MTSMLQVEHSVYITLEITSNGSGALGHSLDCLYECPRALGCPLEHGLYQWQTLAAESFSIVKLPPILVHVS